MNPLSPNDDWISKIIISVSLFIILVVGSFWLLLLAGCQNVPQLADDIEKIADNNAITIKCEKECFQKDTDLDICIKVTNKDKVTQ